MSTFFVYAQGAADAYMLSRDQVERHMEQELEALLGGSPQQRADESARQNQHAGKSLSAALPLRKLGVLATFLTACVPFAHLI